jgi:hypothetical protein
MLTGVIVMMAAGISTTDMQWHGQRLCLSCLQEHVWHFQQVRANHMLSYIHTQLSTYLSVDYRT